LSSCLRRGAGFVFNCRGGVVRKNAQVDFAALLGVEELKGFAQLGRLALAEALRPARHGWFAGLGFPAFVRCRRCRASR
jgi:hypothetical protein